MENYKILIKYALTQQELNDNYKEILKEIIKRCCREGVKNEQGNHIFEGINGGTS